MNLLIRCSVICAILYGFAVGEILPYEKLKNEPKSLAKDYYIYRLADETKYNKSELAVLRNDVYRYKGKLAKKLDAILGAEKINKKCAGFGIKNILKADDACKKVIINPNFISRLSSKNRAVLLNELVKFPNLINLINGMNAKNPAIYFADTLDVENYFIYFNSLSQKEREIKFNFELTPDFANALSKTYAFKGMLEDIVIKDKMQILAHSLLYINPANLGDEIAFLLGINAVKFKSDDKAFGFFKAAAYNSKKIGISQNAKFWMYLINGDKTALKELANSDYYDIYSIIAKEKLGNKTLSVIIPKPSLNAPKNYDISDPFAWVKTKNKADVANETELKKMAMFFDTKATIGEYSYIMNKLNKKDNFYAMPFMEFIGTDDLRRQALILALARQESRFVPSAISTSYALGMMQFMPFVANDIAKKQGLAEFDQDNMFKPEVAYKFANIHLDYLENYLISPVFIAYAYNGGIGFTNRMLKNGLFDKKGKYEPYLAMELVPYAESRDYAKKVLANFVIYAQILGLKVSAEDEILKLSSSEKSDKVR